MRTETRQYYTNTQKHIHNSKPHCVTFCPVCFGCSGLHLAIIHSQQEALQSLTQVVLALPGEEVLNMRNHLYQVSAAEAAT